MSSFFKAWATYSSILVKLMPYGLQGELATALFIDMMNLYDLLEKYTWEGVKGYYFQFHRKPVASGKSIYLPSEWQQLDSKLIASKCFAHPIVRNAWPQSTSRTAPLSRRFSELSIWESLFTNSYSSCQLNSVLLNISKPYYKLRVYATKYIEKSIFIIYSKSLFSILVMNVIYRSKHTYRMLKDK